MSARSVKSGLRRQITHCVIVFVAVDDAGEPVPVPSGQPDTDEEHRLQQYAVHVADARSRLERELEAAYPVVS